MKVAVLMGGKSAEHEISLVSGKGACLSVDKGKHKVFPVVISRDGQEWRRVGLEKIKKMPDPVKLGKRVDGYIQKEGKWLGGVSGLKEMGVEVVFIAMHGPFGEDGCIQGMMEMEGIKYTGSGVLASALGMDKLRFRKVMEADGIAVPKYVVVEKRGNLRNVKAVLGRPPYFVKPHNQGSSVGITLVNKKTELRIAYNLARRYSKTVLVDECVEGIEVTASVLGDEEPRVLPLVEIVPKLGNYFDYRSKYHEGGADEIVPARISKELTKRVQETASDVYQLVGAKGFSRIDFILRDGRKPVVLEINTIPGLTPMSLFPKAARAAGISYSQLIARIIKYAIE